MDIHVSNSNILLTAFLIKDCLEILHVKIEKKKNRGMSESSPWRKLQWNFWTLVRELIENKSRITWIHRIVLCKNIFFSHIIYSIGSSSVFNLPSFFHISSNPDLLFLLFPSETSKCPGCINWILHKKMQ